MKMKKQILLFGLPVLLFSYTSCNNVKDSKESADSLNMAKDTTTMPMVTGGIAVNEDDAQFATAAAVGGMAEVQFARLALSKTSDTAIKDFANMMLTDHGKANEELKAIAMDKNISLPGTIDKDHQQKLDQLAKKNGTDFDKAYANAMIDGHQKMQDLLKKESEKGEDTTLRAFASRTLPVVQMHLDRIQKINDSL